MICRQLPFIADGNDVYPDLFFSITPRATRPFITQGRCSL